MSAPAPSSAPTASGTVDAASAASSSPRPLIADDQHAPPGLQVGESVADEAAEPASITSSSSSSSSSSSASSAVQSIPSPPVARLDRDVLGCILAFSDAKTLAAALSVSKEWLAAVGSMGRVGFTVRCISALIESIAASAIGRRVADLAICSSGRMSMGAVANMVRLMPRLRNLECGFPLVPVEGALCFPAGLRDLQLSAVDDSVSISEVNAAIAGTGRLEQLESLDLRLRRMGPRISFAPLAALPLLRDLTIDVAANIVLTDAQVAELRALSRLQYLDVKPFSRSALQRLLALPHDLQWQRICLPSAPSNETAALLSQLPSLTELSFNAEKLITFDFLRGLPNLTSLRCSSCGVDGNDPQLADQLVAALHHCTRIVELDLSDCDGLTSAHLAVLLPRLSRLQSLSLTHLGIDSLSFLSEPPLTSRLTALRLVHCRMLPFADLIHVHSLRRLRELDITLSFTLKMSHREYVALMSLHPPSAALPLLESFNYQPRASKAD